jgi:hypothetical protein
MFVHDGWLFDDPGALPDACGWYAIAYCWDPQEAIFVGAAFYDGTKWDDESADLPISSWSYTPFPSKETAAAWAEAHDPDRI